MAAAVLSRPQAVVAGVAAAYLHRFRGFDVSRPVILIPSGSNARSDLARVIQTKRFNAVATTRLSGFDVTTAAETIIHLARDLSGARLEAVFDDALLSRKLDLRLLGAVLQRERKNKSKGLGLIREMVSDRHPSAPTLDSTYLEAMLELVLNRADLPGWTREHPFSLGGRAARVDVFIPTWSLVIEADGRNWHMRRSDFEEDRRRDNILATRGIQVLRFTYLMLKSDPDECLVTILRVGSLRNAQGLA
jgi:very-short-patch-repair endonuclease